MGGKPPNPSCHTKVQMSKAPEGNFRHMTVYMNADILKHCDLLKQQQLKPGLSTWAMCVDVEAWVKMSGMLQVELPWSWSRHCLKNILEICCCFPLGCLYFLAEPNNGWMHLHNFPVEKRWWLFYCSISKVVHFELFCSYYTVFALHDFLFVGANVSIFKLWGICLETFERHDFFVASLSPFLAELDICVHVLQLCSGERIYSHDVIIIFLPPHHPYPWASFISSSKLLNSLITKWHEDQFVISSSACTKVLSFISDLQCSLEFILLYSFSTVLTFLPQSLFSLYQ